MKVKFFDVAKALSKKSTYHHQMGAVVVKKNRVLGVGFNKPGKTHPRSNNKFKTIHAELDAILGLPLDELRGADIYVYREYRDGSLAMAKPCLHCQQLLVEVGIRTVYYTNNGEYTEENVA